MNNAFELRALIISTDERLDEASVRDYLLDFAPKTPKVTSIGGGEYVKTTWLIQHPGDETQVKVIGTSFMSLN